MGKIVGLIFLSVVLLGSGWIGYDFFQQKSRHDFLHKGRYAQYDILLDAIERKDVKAVQSQLDKGANPNIYPSDDTSLANDEDVTLLNAAAEDGDVEIVRLLLKHGADPNMGDSWHWNPLAAATRGNYIEVMKLLIRHGARVNDETWGSSALWRAAMDGRTASVNFLLRHGANPNTSVTDDDSKPLKLIDAVKSSYPNDDEIIPLLKAAGAK